MSKQMWEYSVHRVDDHLSAELMETDLNAQGREGWEMVSIIACGPNHNARTIFMKRPLAEPENS